MTRKSDRRVHFAEMCQSFKGWGTVAACRINGYPLTLTIDPAACDCVRCRRTIHFRDTCQRHSRPEIRKLA